MTTLHIVSIGSPESNEFVRDSLVSRAKCRLTAVASVWDLSALSAGKLDIAILHHSVSNSELRSCATYIRHHWPSARILLLHSDAEVLDDALYEERMLPDSSAERFSSMIERLTA